MSYSLTGSGRSGALLPQIGQQELEAHIRHANSQGIEFNYIMNAPNFGGREHDKEWLLALREHLAYLRDIGVNRLTITNDFLIQLVLKEFMEIDVNVSVIAGVDTPDRAEKYGQMGVQCITLNQHTVNRNFEMLTRIRERVYCKLELLANIGCLDHCSHRNAHYKANRILSQSDVSDHEYARAKKNAESCVTWCTGKILLNPLEMLKIPFIRPEDIFEYKNMGIDIIKIEGRLEKSAWLAQVAKIYLEQDYAGDILYLNAKIPFLKKNISLMHGNMEQTMPQLSLDNKKLTANDFLNNLKRFTGKAREDYYASILEDVIRGYDHQDMQAIQKQYRDNIKCSPESL